MADMQLPGQKGKIAKRWDEAFDHVREENKQHHLNHAFLEGYQWMEWHPIDQQVAGAPNDADRSQVTMNHMRANKRTLMSQLTQRELSFEVPPSAYDDATLRAAKIAQETLEGYRTAQNWEVLREAHVTATLKGGTGILAVEWDEEDDDLVVSTLGVPDFVAEPGCNDLETARWWIKLQLLPPDEVQAMYPKKWKKAPKADGRLGQGSQYSYETTSVPLTRVYTYYERPNGSNKKGSVVVEVDGKVMQQSDWNFPFTERLNIAVARESLIENRGYGTTILSDCQSPQTALNAAWSSFIEHMKNASNTRIVMDEAWEDALHTLTDLPGEPLIGPTSAGSPEWMKAPSAPTIILDGIAMLKGELDNLMGVHDVSRGQAPANIESGYGLSILAEKDSSPVGRLIKETARCWSTIGSLALQILEAEVTTERETTVHDGAGPVRRKWKGSDLLGQTGAIVPIDAIVPRSRAAQQQWAEQAVQMGLISPEDPLAVMRFAKLADMPDRRGIIDATLPDVSKAIRENEMVVMDEVPIPREFDDHAIHIEVHNEFRKSGMYDQMTVEQRKDIDNHVKMHEQLAQREMGKRRVGTDIDPALGQLPTAEGSAPMEALPPMPSMPAGEGMPMEGPPPEDAAAMELLQALMAEGGGGEEGPPPLPI